MDSRAYAQNVPYHQQSFSHRPQQPPSVQQFHPPQQQGSYLGQPQQTHSLQRSPSFSHLPQAQTYQQPTQPPQSKGFTLQSAYSGQQHPGYPPQGYNAPGPSHVYPPQYQQPHVRQYSHPQFHQSIRHHPSGNQPSAQPQYPQAPQPHLGPSSVIPQSRINLPAGYQQTTPSQLQSYSQVPLPVANHPQAQSAGFTNVNYRPSVIQSQIPPHPEAPTLSRRPMSYAGPSYSQPSVSPIAYQTHHYPPNQAPAPLRSPLPPSVPPQLQQPQRQPEGRPLPLPAPKASDSITRARTPVPTSSFPQGQPHPSVIPPHLATGASSVVPPQPQVQLQAPSPSAMPGSSLLTRSPSSSSSFNTPSSSSGTVFVSTSNSFTSKSSAPAPPPSSFASLNSVSGSSKLGMFPSSDPGASPSDFHAPTSTGSSSPERGSRRPLPQPVPRTGPGSPHKSSAEDSRALVPTSRSLVGSGSPTKESPIKAITAVAHDDDDENKQLVRRPASLVKMTSSSAAPAASSTLTEALPPLATGSGAKFVPLWKRGLSKSFANTSAVNPKSLPDAGSNNAIRRMDPTPEGDYNRTTVLPASETEASVVPYVPNTPQKSLGHSTQHQEGRNASTNMIRRMASPERRVGSPERVLPTPPSPTKKKGPETIGSAFSATTGGSNSSGRPLPSAPSKRSLTKSSAGSGIQHLPSVSESSQHQDATPTPAETLRRAPSHIRAPAFFASGAHSRSLAQPQAQPEQAKKSSARGSPEDSDSDAESYVHASDREASLSDSESFVHVSDVESDAGRSSARATSPQYGILDMPRKSQSEFVRDTGTRTSASSPPLPTRTTVSHQRSSTLPQPPSATRGITTEPQSMTLKFAAQSLSNSPPKPSSSFDFASDNTPKAPQRTVPSSASQVSQPGEGSGHTRSQTGSRQLPARPLDGSVSGVPQYSSKALPVNAYEDLKRRATSTVEPSRGRQSFFPDAKSAQVHALRQRDMISLDDAPPPSLRRSPSPSSSAPPPPPYRSQTTGQMISYLPEKQRLQSPERQKARSCPTERNDDAYGQPRQSSPGRSSPTRTPPPHHPRSPSRFRFDPEPIPRDPPPQHPARRASPVRPSQRQDPPNRQSSPVRQPSPSRPRVAPPVWNEPSSRPAVPDIQISASADRGTRAEVPRISFPDDGDDDDAAGPIINVSGPEPPSNGVSNMDMPMINVSGPDISVSSPDAGSTKGLNRGAILPPPPVRRGGGLVCGGCGGPIVGRIVNAMGARWHPACFKCTVCSELLEHVSSYEHEGRPYCHLDYHENFAPRCFTCKTAIIDERFITLDDPDMGKRTYHEQHFFCAECGDPFLAPSIDGGKRTGELNIAGDGDYADDEVGFTVYRGHPYCEACHVRLRLPKCKRCKKSIRDGMQAVEALGGKWCWGCFLCTGCEKPFESPNFFLRHNQPFCETCFSILLRND